MGSVTLAAAQQAESAARANQKALPAQAPARITFTNVAQEAGLRFRHFSGASPEKYVLETMGSGAAFLDFDNDGWLDIFLVNGSSVPGNPAPKGTGHALFRNRGDGTFVDVTAKAGVLSEGQYGMGVAAADYDGDGWTDIFVTGFGRNILYCNLGDGTFADVTAKAGVAGGGWSTSAAFFDYDGDGKVDLFVARYVNFAFSHNITCGDRARRIRYYCHPDVYDGMTNLLYRNQGDGTFQDVSQESGIGAHTGKGLGVVAVDFDLDGWVDVYVANDSVRNFLFRNRGERTLEETGVRAGVAFDDGGRPQAGMGTATGDYDGDGRADLIVTNLDHEYNNLYRNLGAAFADLSYQTGFAPASIPLVGWGTGFFDFDNDGDLDVLVVNGHVVDNVNLLRQGSRYPQPKLLFENTGGRFREAAKEHGGALSQPQVSRGAAIGDYDNDGDVDVLVLNLGGAPELLRNDGGNTGRWLSLALEGTKSARDAIGAVVRATVAGKTLTRFLTGGGSYLSASDHRIHLGLGAAESAERIEIRWPSGAVEVLEKVAAGRLYRVREGAGIVEHHEAAPPQP